MSFMKSKLIFLFVLLLAINNKVLAQDIIVLKDSTSIPELEINEAYVSASKSNLKLKEIPASVSILSSKRLEENKIDALPDVSAIVPNFFMPDYGSKLTSPVYIRGIGSRINAPSVGLYVDGVPYFEKAAFNFDFFEIERIEVLRGPQGTLYGRNTMGGILNIETQTPFAYQGTNVKMSVGTYNAYVLNANHYNVLSNKLGYSLSVNYVNKGGYYQNDFLNNKADDLISVGFRNNLIMKVTSNLTIKNIASFESSDEGGYPYAQYDSTIMGDLPISYNQHSSYNRKLFSDALIVDYAGSNVNIKSTTSYQLLDDLQKIDQDFTNDSTLFADQDQIQNMLSQEIIVRSDNEKKYSWLLGGYGFIQRFDKKVDVDLYNYDMNVIKNYDRTIYGGALFHQSSLNNFLIRNFSITTGIRLDYEKDSEDYLYDRGVAGSYTTVDDTTGTLESFVLLPKLAVNYKIGESVVYAGVTNGYKTGGFNSTFDEDRPQDFTYEPEYSWNYEVGVKTSFFNKMMYANAAIFYIDWDNQQIYQTNPSGYGSRLTNAGETESKGIELSLQAEPLNGYNVSINYGYTHATFKSYIVDEQEDYTGNFLPFIPKNTLSFQLNKIFYLKNNIIDNIKVNLLYKGLGKLYFNEDNTASEDFYGVLNANLSFVKNNFQFDIWGRNLTNKNYYTHFFSVYEYNFVQNGRPINFGMDIKFKF